MISVVIPTLNSIKYIKSCLDNIKKVGVDGFEVVFVDGGSNDGTIQYLSDYGDERCRLVVYNGSNIYQAMNRGVELVKNKYIYFCGSDDLINAELFSRIDEVLEDGYDMYIGGVSIYSKEGALKKTMLYKDKYIYKKISRGRYYTPHHQAVIYSKIYFDKLGMYREDLGICSDAEHLLRVLRGKDIAIKFLDKVFCDFYEGGCTSDFLRVWGGNIALYSEVKKGTKIEKIRFVADVIVTAIRYLLFVK